MVGWSPTGMSRRRLLDSMQLRTVVHGPSREWYEQMGLQGHLPLTLEFPAVGGEVPFARLAWQGWFGDLYTEEEEETEGWVVSESVTLT